MNDFSSLHQQFRCFYGKLGGGGDVVICHALLKFYLHRRIAIPEDQEKIETARLKDKYDGGLFRSPGVVEYFGQVDYYFETALCGSDVLGGINS